MDQLSHSPPRQTHYHRRHKSLTNQTPHHHHSMSDVSFDSHFSDASKSSHISGYSHGSSSYGTGKVSAFSSVADLKAQLKKKELIREERIRRRKQMLREQQMHQMQQEEHELDQHQNHDEQRQLPNPISFTITSNLFPAQHRHVVNTNKTFMDEADMALLGFSDNYTGENNEKPSKLNTISEPKNGSDHGKKHNIFNSACGDFEVRDDAGDESNVRNDFEKSNLKTSETKIEEDDGDEATDDNRPSIISMLKKNNQHDDDVSQMTSSLSKIEPDQDTLTTSPMSVGKSSKRGFHRKNKSKKRKLSFTRPFRKMFGKVWRKVKPYFHNRRSRNIFEKEDSIKLNRATGNLC